jgi:AraC-like DNA-binding protein
VDADGRFDYWRQLFVASHLDRQRSSNTKDFRGDLKRSTTQDGITFVNLRADPIVCNFGRRESGLVLLGYVRSGYIRFNHGRDETAELRPEDGLALFDCDRRIVTSSARHDMSYLVLPRSLAVAAIGEDPTQRGTALRLLPRTGLTPILRAHLEALTVHGEQLDGLELQSALGAASSLAVTLLARLRRAARIDVDALDEAFFSSAHRQIELNIGNPGFMADNLAGLLGCSRSHLYRMFARRDKTVAGHLRETRLRRARTMLETYPAEPVGMIALRCGYPDLSAFGKAFRRHFGITPSECRESAQAALLPH